MYYLLDQRKNGVGEANEMTRKENRKAEWGLLPLSQTVSSLSVLLIFLYKERILLQLAISFTGINLL